MTDRYSGFVVTLKDDIRKDEADGIINALSMVKGVLTVRPDLGGGHLAMAEDRAKHRYYMAMHDAVRNVFGESTADRTYPLITPPPRKRLMEPWQWSAIFFISLAAALAIVIVGVHMRDARVEALQKMEKACAGH
jgi:hypothetical protein